MSAIIQCLSICKNKDSKIPVSKKNKNIYISAAAKSSWKSIKMCNVGYGKYVLKLTAKIK